MIVQYTGQLSSEHFEYDSTGQLILSGYISAYYAYYNDSVGQGNYAQLPTTSPYSECFGMQEHTRLSDATQTAYMQSALLAIKYKTKHKLSFYARGEFFSDPDEILTGPIENSHHDLVGLHILGETIGIEYKPIKNSYVRLEARSLHTNSSEDIFIVNHHATNHREELMCAVGVWF